jgi:hypothetical protein
MYPHLKEMTIHGYSLVILVLEMVTKLMPLMFETEIFSQNKSGKFQTKITTSFKKGDLKKLFTEQAFP